jgi:hypothetical protein
MYKRQSITKEMKGYFVPKDTRPGRVQGNPKVHKTNNPLRVIITGRHGTTENIAEFVEKELSENVSNLPSFIKESCFLKQYLLIVRHNLWVSCGLSVYSMPFDKHVLPLHVVLKRN